MTLMISSRPGVESLREQYVGCIFRKLIASRSIVIPNYEWVTGQGKGYGPRVKFLKIVSSVEWKANGFCRVTVNGSIIGGKFSTAVDAERRIWSDLALSMRKVREISSVMNGAAIFETAICQLEFEILTAESKRRNAMAIWNLKTVVPPPAVGIELCDGFRGNGRKK